MASPRRVHKPKSLNPNRTYLFEGRIINVALEDNRYEIVEHDDAVAIVAQRDGKTLFIKQYRPAIGSVMYEIPAGLIDPGESPAQAAAREMAEETGLSGDMELLAQFYLSPGFCNEKLYVFRATNLFEAQGTPDEDEKIEVVWLDPQEVLERSNLGEINISAATLCGIVFSK